MKTPQNIGTKGAFWTRVGNISKKEPFGLASKQ